MQGIQDVMQTSVASKRLQKNGSTVTKKKEGTAGKEFEEERQSMLISSSSFGPKSWHWKHLCTTPKVIFDPPTPTEVHIWCLFPNEIRESNLSLYKGIISHEERTHLIDTTKHKAKEYLLTRVLARTLLAKYAGEVIDPSALIFEKNSFGKPEIIWPSRSVTGHSWNPPNISFNLSHTDSLIACAVTGAFQVGLDVENRCRETHSDLVRFARRRFSQMEAVRLEQMDDFEAQKNHFLELWTLKESYGKALGKGIAGTMLRDIAFDFEEVLQMSQIVQHVAGVNHFGQVSLIKPKIVRSATPLASNFYQFLLLQFTDAHFGAVCVPTIQGSEGIKQPLHLKVMKTIPFVTDEHLLDASLLGFSI